MGRVRLKRGSPQRKRKKIHPIFSPEWKRYFRSHCRNQYLIATCSAQFCTCRAASFRLRATWTCRAYQPEPEPEPPPSTVHRPLSTVHHCPQWPTVSFAHYVQSFQRPRPSLKPPRPSNSYGTNPVVSHKMPSSLARGPSRAHRLQQRTWRSWETLGFSTVCGSPLQCWV